MLVRAVSGWSMMECSESDICWVTRELFIQLSADGHILSSEPNCVKAALVSVSFPDPQPGSTSQAL